MHMVFVRVLSILLLVASGLSFVAYIFTGDPRWKHYGLLLLKIFLAAAAVFFGVLIAERL
jgi:hypothetical protein